MSLQDRRFLTYPNVFVDVPGSLSLGGVAVRDDAPDSSPALMFPPGPSVLRPLLLRELSSAEGPNDGMGPWLTCREPADRPSFRRSSMPTVFFCMSGGCIMLYGPPPLEYVRASPRPVGIRPPPPPPTRWLSLAFSASFSACSRNACPTKSSCISMQSVPAPFKLWRGGGRNKLEELITYLFSDLLNRLRTFVLFLRLPVGSAQIDNILYRTLADIRHFIMQDTMEGIP